VLLAVHNYKRRPKHRRRNISIQITEGKLCTVLAICNRMHGSMNGPPEEDDTSAVATPATLNAPVLSIVLEITR
jgi:hypothetical protein